MIIVGDELVLPIKATTRGITAKVKNIAPADGEVALGVFLAAPLGVTGPTTGDLRAGAAGGGTVGPCDGWARVCMGDVNMGSVPWLASTSSGDTPGAALAAATGRGSWSGGT